MFGSGNNGFLSCFHMFHLKPAQRTSLRYACGFMSCREGGHLWNTISGLLNWEATSSGNCFFFDTGPRGIVLFWRKGRLVNNVDGKLG
jgi:hypothetical protein